MTDERAIEILDPEHREHYEGIEPVNEACRIGMEAIRKVKELKAENAALKERLEKAVELPCKVGDKVYCIHGMSNPEMLEWQVNEIRITDHNYMLQLGRAGTKDYRNEASQFYGKWWFVTREAAEARLKELERGGVNDIEVIGNIYDNPELLEGNG